MSDLSKVFVRTVPPLTNHPNGENLLVGILDGVTFITNKTDGVKEGQSIILIPFDMIVPDKEEFGWVKGQRIKPVKLRGIVSMGACLPNIWGFKEGKDVTDILGFTKYEPENFSGDEIPGPFTLHKYDIESVRAYQNEFKKGEQVLIQTKLDGANICATYWGGKLYVRSRTRWIAEGKNEWWAALPDLSFLKEYEGLVLWGELYGKVKNYAYDASPSKEKIRWFDVWDQNTFKYFNIDEYLSFVDKHDLEIPPVIHNGPWEGLETYTPLVEGKSLLGGEIEEGFVVRSDELNSLFGRKIYKYHSEKWLVKHGKT